MKIFAPPLFDSALLHEAASAIERRGKAIRYHGLLECSRDVEDSGERLNVDFAGHLRIRVRFSIWSDGVMWLCVTQPGPGRTGGWALYHEFRSHVAEFDGPEICRRFGQTIARLEEAQNFWPAFSNETEPFPVRTVKFPAMDQPSFLRE